MRKRRITAMFGAALLLALIVHPPHADISILTHDSTDLSPHRMSAAIDIGIAAVSVLVTWTRHGVAR